MNIDTLLSKYQKDFIRFLVESEALTFGDFTTKSGRKTPYFINTGQFYDGDRISQLGDFYASHIEKLGLSDADTIFGPAYKGIPIAVSTAVSFNTKYQKNIGYTFDRKETKAHGDGGNLVGRKIQAGDNAVSYTHLTLPTICSV